MIAASSAASSDRGTAVDEFPDEIATRLGSYVYRLVDDAGRTFYVGKGKRNRVFAHVRCAIVGEEGLRYERIRELHRHGLEPRIVIHRHGLEDATAMEVEAALIDAYAGSGLTNEVRGFASERGMATLHELAEQYGAEPAKIDVPAILIKIERQWLPTLTPEQLYERTRRYWTCQPEKKAVPPRIAICVARGLIREVYDIHGWEEYPDIQRADRDHTRIPQRTGKTLSRRGFLGKVTRDSALRAALIAKSAREVAFGSGSPYAYVNCGR